MCLIAVALNAHAQTPFLLLANRDEFHDRPALSSHWWSAENGTTLFGGRDLKAGGTWMAVNEARTLAALTNIRQPQAAAGARSRGQLVVDALAAGELNALNLSAFASFNLLLARPRSVAQPGAQWQVSYVNSAGHQLVLPDGIHGLSNATLNTPWPKTRHLMHALERMLDDPDADSVAAGFSALGHRQPWPDEDLPNTGVPPEWERMLSACHIVSPAYGTRCSTVVRVDRRGNMHWHERTFNAAGEVIAEVEQTLFAE